MTHPDTASEIKQQPRILVADDTDVNQKIAQLILQKAGYLVDIAEDGQQAVEACREHPYDLILMDIQMPIMDGREATRRIREWEVHHKNGNDSDPNSDFRIPTSDFKGVPIIAMTGGAGPEGFDETLYPGMNDCIGKPLQRDLLLSVVQKWILAGPKPHSGEHPSDAPGAMDQRPANDLLRLDLERAIQEFMGQKDILMGVLQEFITSAGSRIDTIRRAVKGTDYGTVGAQAHAIKGAAANLAADKLADLASELEKAAVDRQPDLTGKLVNKLEQEFLNLEKYVQQLPDV